jgi:ribonuclease J
MQNWLNYFDLRLYQAHCSGHICGSELKEIIEEINPKKLFPIHTEHPKMFNNLSPKTILIEEAETYSI